MCEGRLQTPYTPLLFPTPVRQEQRSWALDSLVWRRWLEETERREQGLPGEVVSRKYPSRLDLRLSELALVPEQVLTLVPEQVLVLPIVTCLPQTFWHPIQELVFLRILSSLDSSLELSASEGSATTP